MPKIVMDRYGAFNPIMRPFFRCPVCDGDKFVYIVPFGGLWCYKCNAQIECRGTCDGPRKIGIHVYTKYCHSKEWREKFTHCWTVLWMEDTDISWIYRKGNEIVHI